MTRSLTTRAIVAAALAPAVASTAPAADLYWQGGTGALGGANYFDPAANASNVAPAGSDALYIGAGGVATQAGNSLSVSPIVVGHSGTSVGGASGAFPGAGTVQVSGGTLTASVPAGGTVDALAIASAGTGTFTVIGGNATINVVGNMTVYNNPGAQGTLGYYLPAGTLSEIHVTGTATFAVGAVLTVYDLHTVPGFAGTSAVTPTSFDLLTAADIVDYGLTFANGLVGYWNYRIVPGGNGETLQVYRTFVHNRGDVNGDGRVDLADLNDVLNNFGAAGPDVVGDDNQDGVVDLADLNNVLNQFGTAGPVSALSVPEPASLGLLAIGALPLVARRRRTR